MRREMNERLRSRFPSRPVLGDPKPRRVVLGAAHHAVKTAHTLFPSTVATDARGTRALKSGFNSRKIGDCISKGKWKGFAVYTLTLEERATCPRACLHWHNCYGNKMQWAERIAHGPDLEWRIEREVAALALEHRRGFAVRLHNLGDFYSVGYVDLWRRLIERYPELHVWGYTARSGADAIGAAVMALVQAKWDRFAIRFSNAPFRERATVSIVSPDDRPPDAIICPEQTGQTDSCSTCGLCWATTRRVAFLEH